TCLHAFSWTAAGGMVDVGALSNSPYSRATAVNDHGQVVGHGYTCSPSPTICRDYAFSWTANGVMVELGTLGGFNTLALGVNAFGQVIGTSEPLAGVSAWH